MIILATINKENNLPMLCLMDNYDNHYICNIQQQMIFQGSCRGARRREGKNAGGEREAHALGKGLSLGLCREYVYVYFTLQSVETDPCWLVWFVREANALGKGLSLGLCREYVSRNFTLQSVETNPC